MQLRSHAQNTYMYTCNLHTVCKSAHVNGVKHGYILSSRSDNKIIKYGSAKVTKVPKLWKYYQPKVLFFNNKGQVAQILVQKHKCVPPECYV